MIIRYVKQKDIDRNKWDFCIENSVNTMPYAMSWYLDHVCEHWDALVSDDYEAVMPLPWKQKLGIKYIYQPFFAQQLGIFYQKDADDQTYEFLQAIPKSFLKYDTTLNYLNHAKNLALNIRTNYLLPLNKSYNEISKGFNQNTQRNLKKALKENLKIQSVNPDDFMAFTQQENPAENLKPEHFEILKNLIYYLNSNNYAELLGVYSSENKLLGTTCFFAFRNRIIYLVSSSSEAGKEKRVMFLLIDTIIRKHAGSKMILDFEGSMIPGVAQFFKGFGAHPEKYYRLRKSKIPFVK